MQVLFKSLNMSGPESEHVIKQNMLKRFKDIYNDNEREYNRLTVKE